MFAICSRRPTELFRVVLPNELEAGVYDITRGTDQIRIIVASELATREENSLLHLFSVTSVREKYGAEHYSFLSTELSSIINDIFGQYRHEGLTMPYTIEDYRCDVAREVMSEMTPEELRDFISNTLGDDLPELLPRVGKDTELKEIGKQKPTKKKKD